MAVINMKLVCAPIVLLSICVIVVTQKFGPIYDLENAPKLFEEFIQLYERNYTGEEKKVKYKVFYENLVDINRINSDESLTRVAEINEESDLTEDEKRKLYRLHDSVGRQRG